MEGLPLTSLDMSPALRESQNASLVKKKAPQDKSALERVAQEFESVFMSMLLKEMRNTLDEGFFGSESSDVMGGMFDQFLGQHLADSSPFGLKELLVAQKFGSGGPKHDADNSLGSGTSNQVHSAGSAPAASDS